MKREDQIGTRMASSLTVPLHSRVRALLFFALIAAPTLWFVGKTARVSLAQSWLETKAIGTMTRAVFLDPSNPQLHYRLAQAYLLGGEGSGASDPVREMGEAVRLNPGNHIYWSGLARACWAAGDQACADRGFRRAAELAPSKPQVLWEAAVNEANEKRRDLALARLRNLVQLDPGRGADAFQLALLAFRDPQILWSDLAGASANLELKVGCLSFLADYGFVDLAMRDWAELVSSKPVIPFATAKDYLERLISMHQYRPAAEVWRYLLQTGALIDLPKPDAENLLFNGGFERDLLNAGFDWRYDPKRYVQLDFSDFRGSSRTRALRLEFTVPQNLEYYLVNQFVSVEPGQTYVLTAEMRAEAITSDSGPRLRVVDPDCPECLDLAGDGITGTTDWRGTTLGFTAGALTNAVRVSIWRPRGRSFPMEIGGRLWVDNVVLRRAPAPAAALPMMSNR